MMKRQRESRAPADPRAVTAAATGGPAGARRALREQPLVDAQRLLAGLRRGPPIGRDIGLSSSQSDQSCTHFGVQPVLDHVLARGSVVALQRLRPEVARVSRVTA